MASLTVSLDQALQLVGHVGPPWDVIEFRGMMGIGDSDSAEWPWFAISKDDCLQFRMRGDTIEAVLVAPSLLREYSTLRDALLKRGFVARDTRVTRVVEPEGTTRIDYSDEYVNGAIRALVPQARAPKQAGFEHAVTFERMEVS